MPPKAKITRDMLIDTAFEIARSKGGDAISARTVSEKLHCSTQPVMYHFATIEALKKTVHAKADRYHSEYLMDLKHPQKSLMLGIGLNCQQFTGI